MFEGQVVPQGRIDDLDGHGNEGPTFVTDVGLIATGPNVVVVGQIQIEDQLFVQRSEVTGFAQGLAIAWVGGIDRTDLESRRVQA